MILDIAAPNLVIGDKDDVSTDFSNMIGDLTGNVINSGITGNWNTLGTNTLGVLAN
jgi:hypothetical protein